MPDIKQIGRWIVQGSATLLGTGFLGGLWTTLRVPTFITNTFFTLGGVSFSLGTLIALAIATPIAEWVAVKVIKR